MGFAHQKVYEKKSQKKTVSRIQIPDTTLFHADTTLELKHRLGWEVNIQRHSERVQVLMGVKRRESRLKTVLFWLNWSNCTSSHYACIKNEKSRFWRKNCWRNSPPLPEGDTFLISYSRKICRVFLARKIAEQAPRLVSGVLTLVPEETSGCYKRKPMINIL